jgi:superfamily II DNA/RNA helicase
VVAPTRELSLQIYDVLHKLVQHYPWIVPGLVMGGEKKKSEKARLRKGTLLLHIYTHTHDTTRTVFVSVAVVSD